MLKFLFSSCVVIILSAITKSTYGQNSQTVTSGKSTQAITLPVGCTFNWTNNTPSIGLAASGTGDIASFKAINNTGAPITATITSTVSPEAQTPLLAYINNRDQHYVSVIDLKQKTLVKTVPVGFAPVGVLINPFNNRVYVASQGDQSISVIDRGNNAIVSTISSLPDYQEPSGLAINRDGSILYASAFNNGYFLAINTVTNKIIGAIKMEGYPWGIVLSPDGKLVYVTCAEPGKIYIVDTATFQIVDTITTDLNPGDICISPDGKLLYTVNSFIGKVSVIDINSKITVASIPCGQNPTFFALTPDGKKLYVTNVLDNQINVISTAERKITDKIPIDSPTGICMADDGSEIYVLSRFSGDISIINTATNKISSTVTGFPITFSTTFGKFVGKASACTAAPVTYTITVNPAPPASITTTGSLIALSTVYGTPSAAGSFTVSGTNLASGIKVDSPPGFEISTDGVNFSNTITVGNEGDINNAKVFVRLAKTTNVGSYLGNITLTAGVVNTTVSIPNSTVIPASLTIMADDKNKPLGANNPPLTVSYAGFANNDQSSALINLPVITTTALLTSPIGQYPITVSGASSTNYAITYLPGILTITPADIIITSAFTPNADGANDNWAIKHIEYYPGCTVNIFSRSGSRVFSSVGYSIPWDGKLNENALPSGTYYYIIDLKNHLPAKAGWVTIIR